MLEKEFKYYLNNQKELVKKYKGKFIVIKNQMVIGDYGSEMNAYNETLKEHELGTFLIQHCLPGEESHTATFHSRVVYMGDKIYEEAVKRANEEGRTFSAHMVELSKKDIEQSSKISYLSQKN